MKHQPRTIITRILHSTIPVALIAVLLAWAAPGLAHGGFDHVIGKVAKVENGTLTVTTAKGDIGVKLTEKTEITRGDLKAGISDLKPGTRVVVDVPEGSKERIAHSVKLGAASSAAHK